jgi:hypothetical protein
MARLFEVNMHMRMLNDFNGHMVWCCMGLPKGHPLHHPPSAVGISSPSIEASCTCSKVKMKSPTLVGDLSLWRLAEWQMQNLAFLLKDSGCAAKECSNGNWKEEDNISLRPRRSTIVYSALKVWQWSQNFSSVMGW